MHKELASAGGIATRQRGNSGEELASEGQQAAAGSSPRYPIKPALGAVRLCDGIYLGDIFASKDTHFLVMNKITHVINCAGREIPNTEHSVVDSSGNPKKEKQAPVPLGLKYLTFYWLDDDR